jgi:hypothetical protein
LRERTPERAELFPESLWGSFRMTTPSESFPGWQRELPPELFLGSLSEWLEFPQLALGPGWSEETQSLPGWALIPQLAQGMENLRAVRRRA